MALKRESNWDLESVQQESPAPSGFITQFYGTDR